MDIATGAMNTLLPKLGELLVDEYNLQKGVKGEIEELEKEPTSMKVALRKVSEVPVDQLDEQVKIWASDVRELSYDIEDAVDTFMVSCKEHESTKPSIFHRLLDKTTNLLKKGRTNHKIHNVIKDIMSQVKKAKERRDRYNVDGVAAKPEAVPVDLRIEAMFKKATELVGIAGPKNELAKRLMEEDGLSRQQPQIISIVGFGGLGKTTLAKALFDELKAKFDCHFFVPVSLKPNIMNIFKNILNQLDEEKYYHIDEAWDHKLLIEKIREFIKNKRCLCVIDDIWEEQAWDIIKLALPDGNCGSKIITTTRKKGVAKHAGGVYELQPLSDHYSKELLNMRLFGYKDGCPPHLTKVTENILNKCGGVPLAIITIASLLANKPTPQEWEKVNESIGTGMEKSLDVDKMSKILSLSYHDLPPHLKTCLLYLSKYPEDKKIGRDTLVSSWLAEGFITDEGQAAGARLQEIGESYFNELINRSLIQTVDQEDPRFENGQVYYCRVHDMVLELLNQLSAEEGFVTTLFADGQRAAGTSSVQKKIRRLSLHNSGNTFPSLEARERLSQVRSFTVFGSVDSIPPLSSFPVLRVLQLEDCYSMKNLHLKNHLKDLGNLCLLRFLRLYDIEEIPESIGNLQFLHTLDVTTCYLRTEARLPKSFVNLGQLVRLVCWGVRLPHGVALGNMKSLQEVVGIYVVTEYEMQEIGTLTELRVLSMTVDDNAAKHNGNFREALLKCMQRCNKLQDIGVYIYSGRIPEDFMQGVPSGLQRFVSDTAFEEFPGWINSSLSSLTTVDIVVDTCMRQEYLDTLAELPSLLFLRLAATVCPGRKESWICPGRKERIIIRSTGYEFRCLQYLHVITCCTGLTFQPGAMPKLERLRFGYTKYLGDGFDFGLENLPCLRHATFFLIGFANQNNKYVQGLRAAVRKAFDYPNHLTVNLI